MNNQEARFILSAYRAGGQDANLPDFHEALQQAQHDPALAKWLARQTAEDAQIAEAFQKITPPADLRANILAGARVTRRHQRWQYLRPLALAASIILFATFALSPFVHLHRSKTFMPWQAQSIATINDLVENKQHFNHISPEPKELTQWLRASYAPAAPDMPPNLNQLRSLGCKVTEWSGHRISIVCFHLTPSELVHLVTCDGIVTTMPPNTPRFMEHNGWQTATWIAGARTYMLVTKADAEKLKALLL